jgi:hypothetical protein
MPRPAVPGRNRKAVAAPPLGGASGEERAT